MSGVSEVEGVYSAMEEAAGLLGISCSRDKILPILTTFQDTLADSVIIFSMAAGRRATELDFTISTPPGQGDPYPTALANGFTSKTDHPVGALISDLHERYPDNRYAVDGGVTEGFKKIYAVFPANEPEELSKLIDIPSMPRSVAENADLFASYGLDKVTMISVDYLKRAVNLYCGSLPAESVESKTILSMAREMGLQEPSERGLEFAKRSFAIYPTVGWDSSKVNRICLAVITTDPTIVPAPTEEEIAQFSKYGNNAPYAYVGEKRTFVYGLTLTPGEEYYKLGAYYQITDHQRTLVKAFESLKD
ncbi:MAG: hypothetical protein J2P17_22295 [Mycobacterium sp.]|nr:hypothetical protein [Mycobacterium sp.]